MAVTSWLREQRRVYIGNASSVRDYRSQLRGKKAATLWGVYLTILILLALLAYAGIVSQGSQSIARVQADLKGFYSMIRWMLEVAVFLVGPIIVTTSIQGEASRKALDLIVSSPVSQKYYLVGKVVSGFRTIVMMLFLSLPISAAAVVLGGATWGEVLVTYWIIALHGLLCIAITLPLAVMGTKIVPVVFYGYLSCVAWAVLGTYAVALSAWSPSSFEMPFYAMVFPLGLFGDLMGKTDVLGIQVPSWLLATLLTGLIAKFFILGAGSAMTRFGSKETVSLRLHGIVLFGVLSYFLVGAFRAIPVPGPSSIYIGWGLAIATCALFLVVPFLSCWSRLDERKNRAEGFFAPSKILTAAPEGGLPYLLVLLSIVFVANYFRSISNSFAPVPTMAIQLGAWICSFWLFYWSVGWICSAFNRHGVGMARRAQFALTFLAMLIPVPILAYLKEATTIDFPLAHPLSVLFVDNFSSTILAGNTATLLLSAACLTSIGEYKRRSDVLSRKRPDELPSH